MSPLDALPVPLVGSKPFPSVGTRTVNVPPGCGGSAGWVDGAAVTATWPDPFADEEPFVLRPAVAGVEAVAWFEAPPPRVRLVVVSPGTDDVVVLLAPGAVEALDSVVGVEAPRVLLDPLCPQAAVSNPAATSTPSVRARRRRLPPIGGT